MSRLHLGKVDFGSLTRLEAELDAGFHWVSGNELGIAQLIELCCGLVRPKRGTVTLDGVTVDSALSAQIGVLPVEVRLPHVRVDRLLGQALGMKGVSQNPADFLAPWGLAPLALRATQSLDSIEARALVLLLALTTPNAKLLALHEPFALGLSQERLVQQLTRASDAGAVVMMTSLETQIGHDTLHPAAWTLHNGRLLRKDELPVNPGFSGKLSLFVSCDNARALAAHLSHDERVLALKLDESAAPGLLEITGTSLETLAQAVTDSALHSNVEIRHIGRQLSPIAGFVSLSGSSLATSALTPAAVELPATEQPPRATPTQGGAG